MLKRELYLEKIRPFYSLDLIKIIVGIRRSGKSEILKQIRTELISSGINSNAIITINFEDFFFEHLRDPHKLNEYILEKIVDNAKTYIFLDEIQMVADFQRVLASLKATRDVSIFVTGSNSNILSGDLATLLAGRYVSFNILPFTYNETCDFLKQIGRNVDESTFYEYLKWGGLPQRFQLREEDQITTYLRDVYDSIINKDVLCKVDKVDQNLLNRIVRYLFDNTAKVFSVKSVYNYLVKDDRSIQAKVIYSDIDRIVNSRAVIRCQRYDIKGKSILSHYEKFYVTDLGLRTILKTNQESDISYSLETIVHNELVARGYECFVGKTYKGEVDLVVFKDGKKCFIQVSYLLASEETLTREFEAFGPIKDASPKYILSLDKIDLSRDGIIHLNIIDFLLRIEDINLS
jgi:uncharacterized protein